MDFHYNQQLYKKYDKCKHIKEMLDPIWQPRVRGEGEGIHHSTVIWKWLQYQFWPQSYIRLL